MFQKDIRAAFFQKRLLVVFLVSDIGVAWIAINSEKNFTKVALVADILYIWSVLIILNSVIWQMLDIWQMLETVACRYGTRVKTGQ